MNNQTQANINKPKKKNQKILFPLIVSKVYHVFENQPENPNKRNLSSNEPPTSKKKQALIRNFE
jgi:hypothetical protein